MSSPGKKSNAGVLAALLLACCAATGPTVHESTDGLYAVRFKMDGQWVSGSDLDRRARQHFENKGLPVPSEIKPVLDLFVEGSFVRVGYWTDLGAPFWVVSFDKNGQIIASEKGRVRG